MKSLYPIKHIQDSTLYTKKITGDRALKVGLSLLHSKNSLNSSLRRSFIAVESASIRLAYS